MHKIGCLEAKVSVLENGFSKNVNTNSESNVKTEIDKTKNYILEEESRKELNCKLCDKVFKSESNLLNHDKKFHMKEGTTTYKCDNCNEKLANKIDLEFVLLYHSNNHTNNHTNNQNTTDFYHI